ncbi:hypothetical protein [Streptomyces sp. NPDC005302]|uniref:hypothetical protein n=1 Tax=Streptomyces sp. NPDC005302 TaxID=3154675 RepID=UPI0033AC6F13
MPGVSPEEQLAAKNRHIGSLTAQLAAEKETAKACANQMERALTDLCRVKDVIAAHIARAGHPDTVLHDVTAFALSLQQTLAAEGIDLRIELHRLEGSAAL